MRIVGFPLDFQQFCNRSANTVEAELCLKESSLFYSKMLKCAL